jgi:hypothetical protein
MDLSIPFPQAQKKDVARHLYIAVRVTDNVKNFLKTYSECGFSKLRMVQEKKIKNMSRAILK